MPLNSRQLRFDEDSKFALHDTGCCNVCGVRFVKGQVIVENVNGRGIVCVGCKEK